MSEIIKYGEKMKKIDKNVKQCKKNAKNGPKTPNKWPNFGRKNVHRFSGSKLPEKMVLAVFTRCLVPEIHIFGHFWLKSAGFLIGKKNYFLTDLHHFLPT